MEDPLQTYFLNMLNRFNAIAYLLLNYIRTVRYTYTVSEDGMKKSTKVLKHATIFLRSLSEAWWILREIVMKQHFGPEGKCYKIPEPTVSK